MSPEWLASKNNEELGHWVLYYEEELKILTQELARRLVDEN